MLTFSIPATLAVDSLTLQQNYMSVEAGEIICSAKGLITEATTATRIKVTKDKCFSTVYPVPSGTNINLLNHCIFCGASG